jgi:hypothetical protein
MESRMPGMSTIRTYRECALLENEATAQQIAAHLDEIATQRMGLSSNMNHCDTTAQKLLEWRKTLLKRRPEILG